MQHYVVPHNRREKEAPARKEDDVATRVVVAGYVAKKVGVSLGIPSTLECGAKLGIGIVTATVHVKWAQDKYYLPVNVFKIP